LLLYVTTEQHSPYPRVTLTILYMKAFGISHIYGRGSTLSSTTDHPQDDPEHKQILCNRHALITVAYLLRWHPCQLNNGIFITISRQKTLLS